MIMVITNNLFIDMPLCALMRISTAILKSRMTSDSGFGTSRPSLQSGLEQRTVHVPLAVDGGG